SPVRRRESADRHPVRLLQPGPLRTCLLFRGGLRSFLFDQFAPEDFARRGLRDLVDRLHQPDLLMRRDALGDKLNQLLGRRLRLQHHERLGTSPASSSGLAITAASATAGCVNRMASSSAGGTWY